MSANDRSGRVKLYELCRAVTEELERRYENDAIGLVMAKGAMARETGFLVALVGPKDPDDPEKIYKLKQAAANAGIILKDGSPTT